MTRNTLTVLLVLGGAGIWTAWARGADEGLDKAFEALKTYDFGQDRSVLQPIDKAVAASHSDLAARKALESRLAEILKAEVPMAAKDFACRQLSLAGTAASVPALAALLADDKLSHMARYALERIPDDAAVQALRDALPRVSGLKKVGVINSLAVRRDAPSTAAMAALLQDGDQEVVSAAAAALGAIGTAEAAQALAEFRKKAPQELRLVAADASLACAERLLAAGNKAQAMAIYKALLGADQPRHVQLAARRGLLAAMGQK